MNWLVVPALLCLVTLSGCEDDRTFENAGEKIDKATEDISDEVEEAVDDIDESLDDHGVMNN